MRAETLEKRQMLAADVSGDSFSDAEALSIQPGMLAEYDRYLGDGNHGPLDVDFFKIYLNTGDTVDVDVDANLDDTSGSQISYINSYLKVFDATGETVISNDNAISSNDYVAPVTNQDSYLSFTANATGDYFIAMSSASNTSYDPTIPGSGSGSGSASGNYRLQLFLDAPAGPSVSISDVVVNENENTAEFDVNLSQSMSAAVMVDYATVDGNAIAGADYSAVGGQLTFAPGETVKSIIIPIIDDSEDEADESFNVLLSNVSGATLTDGTGTATIIDDDTPPSTDPGDSVGEAQSVTLTTGTVLELEESLGDGVSGSADVDFFKINLAAGQSINIDVDANFEDVTGNTISGINSYLKLLDAGGNTLTTNDNALSSNDYMAPAPNDDSYLSYTANVAGDYFVAVSDALNTSYSPFVAGSGSPATTGDYRLQLLMDGGAAPSLNISDLIVDEFAGSAHFNVTLSEPSSTVVTVDYATSDGNANAGPDYSSAFGQLSFAPGETIKTISVPIVDDSLEEADETFNVQLTNAFGATIAGANGVATIVDNDAPPPNSEPGDSIGNAAEMTLTPGTLFELNETLGDGVHGSADVDFFKVHLASGQTIEVDVDANFEDVTGNALSGINSYINVFDATGELETSNDNAISNNDYSAPAPNEDSFLTFTANATGDYFIAVSDAWNSSFDPLIAGSGTSATPGDYRLQLLIDSGAVPSLNIADVSVDEDAGTADVNVTLSEPSSSVVTVDYSTNDGNAVAGPDYSSTFGQLSFAPGETSKTISVPIVDDSLDESVETFNVGLSNASGATIADPTGVATIVDNDTSPPSSEPGDNISTASELTLSPGTLLEVNETLGDGVYGSADVDFFKVQLVFGQGIDIDVDANFEDATGTSLSGINSYVKVFDATGALEASNDTALSSNDYSAPAPNNDSFLTFTANATGDYFIAVSDAWNSGYDPMVAGSGTSATPGDYRLQLMIGAGAVPTISVVDISVNEDVGTADFDVTLSEPANGVVTVDYSTIDGNAIAGSDYTTTFGQLTFAPGESIKTISIPIIDDSSEEQEESFDVQLSNADGASIGVTTGSVAIVDDDTPALVDPGDSIGDGLSVTLVDGSFQQSQAIGDGSHGLLDVDIYHVHLQKGQILSIDIDLVDSQGGGNEPLDSLISVFDAQSQLIDFNDDGVAPGEVAPANDGASYLSFAPSLDGDYYVAVSSSENGDFDPSLAGSGMASVGSTGNYDLNITVITFNNVPSLDPGVLSVTPNSKTILFGPSIGYSDLDGDPLGFIRVLEVPNPDEALLTLNGNPVHAGQLIFQQNMLNGELQLETFGTTGSFDAFRLTASDGIHESDEAIVTVAIADSSNSAPTTSDTRQSTRHGDSIALEFPFTDDNPNSFSGVLILDLPHLGDLTLNGQPIHRGQFIESGSGDITYTPSSDGTPFDYETSIRFAVKDDVQFSDPAQKTIKVGPTVPAAPTANSFQLTIGTVQQYVLFESMLGYQDANGDPMQSLKILPDPTGDVALALNNQIVGLGTIITADQLAAGALTLASSATTGSTTIGFSVSDGEFESTSYNLNLTVDSTVDNSPPETLDFIVRSTFSAPVELDFPFLDNDLASYSGVVIHSLPTKGTLTSDGVPITVNQFVSSASGPVVYNPSSIPSPQHETFSFQYSVKDDAFFSFPSSATIELAHLENSVENFGLVQDTGIDQNDNSTINPTLKGNVSSPISVQFDIDGDGMVDATLSVATSPFEFTFDPRTTDPEFGDSDGVKSVSYRVIQTIGVTTETSHWNTFDFYLEPTPTTPYIASNVSHIVERDATGSDLQVVMSGDIVLDPNLIGPFPDISNDVLKLEIDIDSDGVGDIISAADTEFRVSEILNGLQNGDNEIHVRALEVRPGFDFDLTGPWQPYAFHWDNSLGPRITSLTLSNDTGAVDNDAKGYDPSLSGQIAHPRDGIENIRVEFEFAPGTATVRETLVDLSNQFHYTALDLSIGNYDVRARTISWDNVTATEIFGPWYEYQFNYVPLVIPEITELELLIDNGESDSDGISSSKQIYGIVDPAFGDDFQIYVDFDPTDTNDYNLVVTPQPDGQFLFDPTVSPGQHSFAAWPKRTNTALGTIEIGSTVTIDFEYVPNTSDLVQVQNLRLYNDNGIDHTDFVTSDPTIVGNLVNDESVSYLDVEYAIGPANSDPAPAGTVTIVPFRANEQGDFRFTPVGLSLGDHNVYVRGIEYDYDLQEKRFGDWEILQFELVADENAVPVIRDLSLLSDSGVAGDLLTENTTIVGWVENDDPGPIEIEIDHFGDGSVDQRAATDQFGAFRFEPSIVPTGSFTVGVRGVESNNDGVRQEGAWEFLTFTYEDQVDSAPELHSLEFHANIASPTLSGAVIFQHDVAGVRVEVDAVGNQNVTHTGTTNANGRFVVDLDGLGYDVTTIHARSVGFSPITHESHIGSWIPVTISYPAPTIAAPMIASLSLVNEHGSENNLPTVFDPTVTGTVDRLPTNSLIVLEIDYGSVPDNTPDARIALESTTDWTFRPDLAPGSASVSVRALDYLSDGTVLAGGWSQIDFVVLQPETDSELPLHQQTHQNEIDQADLERVTTQIVADTQLADALIQANIDLHFEIITSGVVRRNAIENANLTLRGALDSARSNYQLAINNHIGDATSYEFTEFEWPEATSVVPIQIPDRDTQPTPPRERSAVEGPTYELDEDQRYQEELSVATRTRDVTILGAMALREKLDNDAQELFDAEAATAHWKAFDARVVDGITQLYPPPYPRPQSSGPQPQPDGSAPPLEGDALLNRAFEIDQELQTELNTAINKHQKSNADNKRNETISLSKAALDYEVDVALAYERAILDWDSIFDSEWTNYRFKTAQNGTAFQVEYRTAKLARDIAVADALREREYSIADANHPDDSSSNNDPEQSLTRREILIQTTAAADAKYETDVAEADESFANSHTLVVQNQFVENNRALNEFRINDANEYQAVITQWHSSLGTPWSAMHLEHAQTDIDWFNATGILEETHVDRMKAAELENTRRLGEALKDQLVADANAREVVLNARTQESTRVSSLASAAVSEHFQRITQAEQDYQEALFNVWDPFETAPDSSENTQRIIDEYNDGSAALGAIVNPMRANAHAQYRRVEEEVQEAWLHVEQIPILITHSDGSQTITFIWGPEGDRLNQRLSEAVEVRDSILERADEIAESGVRQLEVTYKENMATHLSGVAVDALAETLEIEPGRDARALLDSLNAAIWSADIDLANQLYGLQLEYLNSMATIEQSFADSTTDNERDRLIADAETRHWFELQLEPIYVDYRQGLAEAENDRREADIAAPGRYKVDMIRDAADVLLAYSNAHPSPLSNLESDFAEAQWQHANAYRIANDQHESRLSQATLAQTTRDNAASLVRVQSDGQAQLTYNRDSANQNAARDKALALAKNTFARDNGIAEADYQKDASTLLTQAALDNLPIWEQQRADERARADQFIADFEAIAYDRCIEDFSEESQDHITEQGCHPEVPEEMREAYDEDIEAIAAAAVEEANAAALPASIQNVELGVVLATERGELGERYAADVNAADSQFLNASRGSSLVYGTDSANASKVYSDTVSASQKQLVEEIADANALFVADLGAIDVTQATAQANAKASYFVDYYTEERDEAVTRSAVTGTAEDHFESVRSASFVDWINLNKQSFIDYETALASSAKQEKIDLQAAANQRDVALAAARQELDNQTAIIRRDESIDYLNASQTLDQNLQTLEQTRRTEQAQQTSAYDLDWAEADRDFWMNSGVSVDESPIEAAAAARERWRDRMITIADAELEYQVFEAASVKSFHFSEASHFFAFNETLALDAQRHSKTIADKQEEYDNAVRQAQNAFLVDEAVAENAERSRDINHELAFDAALAGSKVTVYADIDTQIDLPWTQYLVDSAQARVNNWNQIDTEKRNFAVEQNAATTTLVNGLVTSRNTQGAAASLREKDLSYIRADAIKTNASVIAESNRDYSQAMAEAGRLNAEMLAHAGRLKTFDIAHAEHDLYDPYSLVIPDPLPLRLQEIDQAHALQSAIANETWLFAKRIQDANLEQDWLDAEDQFDRDVRMAEAAAAEQHQIDQSLARVAELDARLAKVSKNESDGASHLQNLSAIHDSIAGTLAIDSPSPWADYESGTSSALSTWMGSTATANKTFELETAESVRDYHANGVQAFEAWYVANIRESNRHRERYLDANHDRDSAAVADYLNANVVGVPSSAPIIAPHFDNRSVFGSSYASPVWSIVLGSPTVENYEWTREDLFSESNVTADEIYNYDYTVAPELSRLSAETLAELTELFDDFDPSVAGLLDFSVRENVGGTVEGVENVLVRTWNSLWRVLGADGNEQAAGYQLSEGRPSGNGLESSAGSHPRDNGDDAPIPFDPTGLEDLPNLKSLTEEQFEKAIENATHQQEVRTINGFVKGYYVPIELSNGDVFGIVFKHEFTDNFKHLKTFFHGAPDNTPTQNIYSFAGAVENTYNPEVAIQVFVTDQTRLANAQLGVVATEIALHAVPLGAAADYISQGDIYNAGLSLVGDAAGALTFGAGKVFQVGKASVKSIKIGSKVGKAGLAIETGLGVYRTAEGAYLISQGQGGSGEIAEGVLRLLGVSISLLPKRAAANEVDGAVGAFGETGCFAAGTPVSIIDQRFVPDEPNSSQSYSSDMDNSVRVLQPHQVEKNTATRFVPIEEVDLGSRVPAHNPDRTDADPCQDFSDASQWGVITVIFRHKDGSVVDLELIRQREWIESHDLQPGKLLNLSFPEIEALGQGIVTSISPCPEIQQGAGSCVTGRFKTRQVSHLLEVTLETSEKLWGTPNHRIWSTSVGDWQRLDELVVGSLVKGSCGDYRIESISHVNRPQSVFNLEIDGEHVYQVTKNCLIVHNNNQLCEELAQLLARQRNGEVVDVDRIAALRRLTAPRVRSVDDLLVNGAVPANRGGAFSRWFDNLTPDELDSLWRSDRQIGSSSIRELIEDRTRSPGRLHEWLMAGRAIKFKRWGVGMDTIKDLRTLITDRALKLKRPSDLPWHIAPAIPRGYHSGPLSGRFHYELRALIDASRNYSDFTLRMRRFAERWLPNGIQDLPPGLIQ